MLARKTFLQRSLLNQAQYGAMVQTGSRGFGGGGEKKPAIDPNTTDYDLVLVGK